MAKERVIPLADLEAMLDELRAALDCGNRALVRSRLADFIADDHEEDRSDLAIATVTMSGMDA